jgi:hypothetical protein
LYWLMVSIYDWVQCLRPVERQKHSGRVWWMKSGSAHSRKQREPEKEIPGTRYSLQRHTTTSDPPPPTSSHLLITHSAVTSSVD